jgi:hypothetical protein
MRARLITYFCAQAVTLGLLSICCTPARANSSYSPPRQALTAEHDPGDLLPAQRRVVLTVLHAVQHHPEYLPHLGIDATDLFYALPRRVLVLFFGDHRFPRGTIAAGYDSCPKTQTEGCREFVDVIGSENLIYYPAPRGGPGDYEGLLISAGPGEPLDALGKTARRAYCDNGVGGAWGMPWGFWDRSPAPH